MDEASAWRELAARFTELGQLDQNRLYACWSSSPFNDRGEQWFISGGLEQLTVDSFEWAAERAAVLLGQPLGRPTLFHWLDLLRENSPRYIGGGRSVSRRGDEILDTAETGRIRSVCIASAEYCYKLETAAIAKTVREWRELSNAELGEIVDDESTAAPNTPPDLAIVAQYESIADQLKRLREESRLTYEKLAEELEVDTRSVERHFAGKAKPRIGHIGGYERVFSEALKRKIVIIITPVKRR
jgi:ribosome-binding protein aMBF1 (putative translation factor)